MISAKIILHTVNMLTGAEAITWELEYPRFIHSELMTHRMFSRNAASSRAIPISKTIEQVRNNPAMPVHWGKNQSGMQAKQELEQHKLLYAKVLWKLAAEKACTSAEELNEEGLHKQIVNRVLEPYVWMKTIVTSTERNNWYHLRYHEDAQPEIKELAMLMRHAEDNSIGKALFGGEWHLPYLSFGRDNESDQQYFYTENESKREYYTLEEAQVLSASLCAQVSYRKSDDSLEKAQSIYNRLIESEPVHASPVEHQLLVAKPGFAEHVGWTHVDRNGQYWSGNIRGYVQMRQLIPDNVKRG